MEEWRYVVGFENLYIVSNLGNVMSLPRMTKFGRQQRFFSGKLLKLTESKTGYYTVSLSNGVAKHRPYYVHRLVAQAFIPNPFDYLSVDHINCDRHDNRVENLRWCSLAQNTKYQHEMGHTVITAEARENSRLTCSKPLLRSDGKHYRSIREAAKDVGVSPSGLAKIVRTKRTVQGYSFEFERSEDELGKKF